MLGGMGALNGVGGMALHKNCGASIFLIKDNLIAKILLFLDTLIGKSTFRSTAPGISHSTYSALEEVEGRDIRGKTSRRAEGEVVKEKVAWEREGGYLKDIR